MESDNFQFKGRRFAAALVLSLLHILSMLGAEYQAGNLHHVEFDKFFLVNYAVFLAPVVVLLFLSFFGYIGLVLFGAPVLVFFVLRMHHLWEYYRYGINSMSVPKGDGLGFFQLMFDMMACLIGAAVGAIAIVFLLARCLKLSFRANS